MKIKKFIFFLEFMLFFLSLVCASSYGEGLYGANIYVGTATTEDSSSVSTNTESTDSSGYSPKIYFSDDKFSTEGNNFSLRFNEKIKFIVNSVNHTLTLIQFNDTTAKIRIESDPVFYYLTKGILNEFDINNDSIKNLLVKYEGKNGTKAMIFMQEIIAKLEKEDFPITGDSVSDTDKKEFNWKTFGIIIVIILLIIAFILWKFIHRKKRNNLFGY